MKFKLNKFRILLFINIVVAIYTAFIIHTYYTEKNRLIIGSFQEGSDRDFYRWGNIHLVFDSRGTGTYTLYLQFEVLEHGFFTQITGAVYKLQSEDGNTTRHVIYDGGRLHLVTYADQIVEFFRISNIPTYINVSPPVHLWGED